MDPYKVEVELEGTNSIVTATNIAGRKLELETRKKFNRIFSTYLHRYGIDGVQSRMINKSIGEIIDEFDNSLLLKPSVEGEIGGMKYQLFDPVEQTDEDE
ncbi:hypothetical protein [Rubinisphaera italica]|uniref:Uncharacterized protein n=1 Tax=Rubinisphaera italica TaxID=2527969 RepID=A0A5C5X9Q8_9PLAN|nr:hypothetical protein [Rubinisphaera italica]TWT59736.1 hypothetical protein Pan54_04460 [Rubinisphaera italica]